MASRSNVARTGQVFHHKPLCFNGLRWKIEVEDELVTQLEQKARDGGHDNVVVVKGEYTDPLLPDAEIDLILFCNSYHHIEDRVAYFDRLRSDLAEGGRVALMDLKAVPLVRLLAPHGHWTTVETMAEEMGQASYTLTERFDFLPAQSFVVFRPQVRPAARRQTRGAGRLVTPHVDS